MGTNDTSAPAPGTTPVVEVAQFTVTPGTEAGFVEAYRGVRGLIADTPGCRSVRLTRGVESPSIFVLLVEWDSLEAHTEGFRGSPQFLQWRAAVGPFFADDPVVRHTTDVDDDLR